MVTFCVLVFPLPYAVRKGLFRFLSESPIIAKVAYGLKISFMCAPCPCAPPPAHSVAALSVFSSQMPSSACSALPPSSSQPAQTTPSMTPALNPPSPRASSSESSLCPCDAPPYASQCPAEYVSHRLLLVPLPCLDTHLLDRARPHPGAGRLRQVEKGGECFSRFPLWACLRMRFTR